MNGRGQQKLQALGELVVKCSPKQSLDLRASFFEVKELNLLWKMWGTKARGSSILLLYDVWVWDTSSRSFRVVVVEVVVSTHLKNIKSSQIWIISPNMSKNKKHVFKPPPRETPTWHQKKKWAANLPKKPVPQWLPWVCTASHRNNTPRRAGESSVDVRVSWRFGPSFDSASKWPTKHKEKERGKEEATYTSRFMLGAWKMFLIPKQNST